MFIYSNKLFSVSSVSLFSLFSFSHYLIVSDVTLHNHPVHIITKDNLPSPSALIPFCEFGGSMSVVGIKIDQFDVPVCNCFQARILNDQ